MRILLDECVPRRLKRSFRGHQLVLTVPDAGFTGLKNGNLLRHIVGKFHVFITTDKSIQRNWRRTGLAVDVDFVDCVDLVDEVDTVTKVHYVHQGRNTRVNLWS